MQSPSRCTEIQKRFPGFNRGHRDGAQNPVEGQAESRRKAEKRRSITQKMARLTKDLAITRK